jgi:hypothetical protein
MQEVAPTDCQIASVYFKGIKGVNLFRFILHSQVETALFSRQKKYFLQREWLGCLRSRIAALLESHWFVKALLQLVAFSESF